jgi:hypothetical protein
VLTGVVVAGTAHLVHLVDATPVVAVGGVAPSGAAGSVGAATAAAPLADAADGDRVSRLARRPEGDAESPGEGRGKLVRDAGGRPVGGNCAPQGSPVRVVRCGWLSP